LILSKLREDFPERIISTFSVLPIGGSDVVVEAYNTCLSLHQLIENADIVNCVDNSALNQICQDTLKISNPSFNDLNPLISQVMSGVTCGLRFPGQLNSDLRKMAVNLIPFSRLHFFMVGFAPLTSIASKTFEPTNVAQITSQFFDPRNLMLSCDTRLGKYLTACCMFRGETVSTKEVDKQLAQILMKNPNYFVPWVPNNITSSVCNVPPIGMKLSGTFIANSTAIQHVFEKTKTQFTRMFRKKAFLHWYIDEGMDELEFSEAESNINDLISEYQQYQDAGIEVPREEIVDNSSVINEESESESVFFYLIWIAGVVTLIFDIK